ncbi:hypothetical protein C0991_010206 [Blastosporella zonata]|nr:hypothetical protein C0991_010206 [Blastosporella zonata]
MAVSVRVVGTLLVICLHVRLVSTSPAQFGSLSKHAKWMWARQVRQDIPSQAQAASWPTNHSPEMDKTGVNDPPYRLPRVADVFKMVADTEAHQSAKQQVHASPTGTPQLLALTPTSFPPTQPSAVLVPTTTIVQPSSPYRGPGLVIPSSTIDPEAAPAPTESSTSHADPLKEPSDNPPVASHPKISGTDANPTETSEILDTAQPTPITSPSRKGSMPVHNLVVIGAVMAGLIVLMFLAYVVLNRRLFAMCRRKKEDHPDSWKKISSPPPPGTYYGAEKEIEYQTPHSPRSASSVYSSRRSGESTPDSSGPVIDIGRNYPRSKFSLCSSEYPPSDVDLSSEAYLHCDDTARATLCASSEILPSYQFYDPPPEAFDDRCHSRAHSVPVVCPTTSLGAPELMLRAIQHRRSRSVSGLAYTVKSQWQEQQADFAGGELNRVYGIEEDAIRIVYAGIHPMAGPAVAVEVCSNVETHIDIAFMDVGNPVTIFRTQDEAIWFGTWNVKMTFDEEGNVWYIVAAVLTLGICREPP